MGSSSVLVRRLVTKPQHSTIVTEHYIESLFYPTTATRRPASHIGLKLLRAMNNELVIDVKLSASGRKIFTVPYFNTVSATLILTALH